MENSVDFPAPFGPTRPMRSRRFTSSETSSNNVRPPKDLLTSEIMTMQPLIVCGKPRLFQAGGSTGNERVAGGAEGAGEFAELGRKDLGAMATGAPFHGLEIVLYGGEQGVAGPRDAAADDDGFGI